MRAATTLSLLALLGSALAAPAPHHRKGKVVYETVVKTVYYTPGAAPAPTPAPQPEQPKPAEPEKPKVTSVAVAPTEPPKEEAAPPKEETTQEAPSTNSGYMGVVDTWRAKLNLKKLTHSDKLEANALNCVTESNGIMKHKLNPGSMGQVLAPGTADNFEHVFVGGWLCEVPSTPGLGAEVCNEQSKGWAYNGQTGHNEILVSPNYSEIGCALFNGIWGCDLA